MKFSVHNINMSVYDRGRQQLPRWSPVDEPPQRDDSDREDQGRLAHRLISVDS
jgi:hypothetical protein